MYGYLSVHVALFQLIDHKKPRRQWSLLMCMYRYLTVHVVLFQLISHKKPRRLVPTHVYRYLSVHVVLFQLIDHKKPRRQWSLLLCMGILVYMLYCFS